MTTPVFLLGIYERSGTNFLYELLRQHPDVGVRKPIWEDKLLQHAQHLVAYVDDVVSSWDPKWGVPAEERTRLSQAMGEGLRSFVTHGVSTSHVLVKTPSVRNLAAFPDLFPDAALVVLTRDGRDVAESAHRSFGWSYPSTIAHWADGARTILASEPALTAAGAHYCRLRYEDLLEDLRSQLTAVFDSCGLDPVKYDFERAASAPVIGSSSLRPSADGPVEWERMDRPEDFRSTNRHEQWDASLRHLYDAVAGPLAVQLGYPAGPLPALDASGRLRLLRYRAALAFESRRRARG